MPHDFLAGHNDTGKVTDMSVPAREPDPMQLKAKALEIPLASRVLIMGVLNVTPDSFSDGGRFLDPAAALAQAETMVAQGADLIDLGAESTRPGAEPVDETEELRRLMPVIEALASSIAVPLSVDTTKAGVAQRALDAGASIVNDISAMRLDPGMAQVVAKTGAGVVLMHMQGTPPTMQRAPRYEDVPSEVRAFLATRMAAALEAGIRPDQILLDPGFGFGKTVAHNLTLLARLDELAALGRPVLVGVSRKAFIGQTLAREVGDRLMGTAAAVALAVERGARLVRVHDVEAIRDVVRMTEAVLCRPPDSHRLPRDRRAPTRMT